MFPEETLRFVVPQYCLRFFPKEKRKEIVTNNVSYNSVSSTIHFILFPLFFIVVTQSLSRTKYDSLSEPLELSCILRFFSVLL